MHSRRPPCCRYYCHLNLLLPLLRCIALAMELVLYHRATLSLLSLFLSLSLLAMELVL